MISVLSRLLRRTRDRLQRLSHSLATALIGGKSQITRSLVNIGRPRIFDISRDDLYSDSIRQSALELCAYEIHQAKLVGSIAELGVYRGEFAALLNKAFPERQLYLFDTFSGFDKKELAHEQEREGLIVKNKDFSATSIELVLKKMLHPERCIVRRGVFPDTAKDLEVSFVFVSIDADLYQPVYEGLKFFYPKLARGGYIFIHDFNNQDWPGASKAVRQYCREQGAPFFLLPDTQGTAVIAK